MNPKIPVLGVVGALALVIVVISYSGTSIIDDTSGEVRIGTSGGMPTLIPLIIELEDIEILRFLEQGYKVKMIKMSNKSLAIDNPKDLKKAKIYLKFKNSQRFKLIKTV